VQVVNPGAGAIVTNVLDVKAGRWCEPIGPLSGARLLLDVGRVSGDSETVPRSGEDAEQPEEDDETKRYAEEPEYDEDHDGILLEALRNPRFCCTPT
jgi:hypothetical protein